MFSEELQSLIDASLTDGKLTDKEREVIRKRALLEHVDPDELDIYLDAEVQKRQQENNPSTRKVRKCPNCGEAIPVMAMKCPTCGYEFSEQRVNKIVERFTEGRKRSLEYGDSEDEVKFIRNFTIPNNADDLIEMTIYLSSAVKNSGSLSFELESALRQKLQECQSKSDALYANDERFIRLRETTKLSWWQRQSSIVKVFVVFGALIALCMVLMIIFPEKSSSTDRKEKVEKVEKEVSHEHEEATEPASAKYETEETEKEAKAAKDFEETEVEKKSEPVSDIDADNAVKEAKEKSKGLFNKLKKKAADKVKKAAEKMESKLSDDE